ncbi:hypothetical protein DJ031_04595 [bacterium endosymbiont of Escarpia laminata]|nr:MAG: hypothetical protein DJ031_04595 [bacterium endosymbiont of Escarpia laminata]
MRDVPDNTQQPAPGTGLHQKAVVVKKGVICLLLLLVLTGCSSLDQYRSGAIQTITEANDRVLQDAELGMFRLPSQGAVDRRYGTDPELTNAYNELKRALQQRGMLMVPVITK